MHVFIRIYTYKHVRKDSDFVRMLLLTYLANPLKFFTKKNAITAITNAKTESNHPTGLTIETNIKKTITAMVVAKNVLIFIFIL